MPLFARELTYYFPRDSLEWATPPLDVPPATVFLTEVVEICDAVNHCIRHFPRRKDGTLTTDSSDAFQRLSMSAFALLLSNFETFQKEQFAILINHLDYMGVVDDVELAKRLEKAGCSLSLQRILTGRGEPREPGQIIADSLPGWHNPERVNSYFRVVIPAMNLFSSDIVNELELMWQLRHSIVHTGGVVTREDAIKVAALRSYRDRRLRFSESFIPAIGRRLHIITEDAGRRLRTAVEKIFIPVESPDDTRDIIDVLVGWSSPRKSWFRSPESAINLSSNAVEQADAGDEPASMFS